MKIRLRIISFPPMYYWFFSCYIWRLGVVVITAYLHSSKHQLRLCTGSSPARGVSEIRDSDDLRQWSPLEIRINAFRRSTIPQKQFIIVIIIITQVDTIKSFRYLGEDICPGGGCELATVARTRAAWGEVS